MHRLVEEMRVHLSRLHYTAMIEKIVNVRLRVDLELPDLAFSSENRTGWR